MSSGVVDPTQNCRGVFDPTPKRKRRIGNNGNMSSNTSMDNGSSNGNIRKS